MKPYLQRQRNTPGTKKGVTYSPLAITHARFWRLGIKPPLSADVKVNAPPEGINHEVTLPAP